jgi:predicted DNA-binding transcriptional regulator YafY
LEKSSIFAGLFRVLCFRLFSGEVKMGEKKDIYRSYGQKLISLFVRLLFSGESYSLTDLSRLLDCSKQTVLRLLNDITMAYGVTIDEVMKGNRKYVRIKRPERLPLNTAITEMELQVLQMCRDFTAHLLGKPLFEEATRALLKSRALLPGEKKAASQHFATFRPGCIDYTSHFSMICTLIEAMEKKRICRLLYQPIMEDRPKTYHVKPLKIFSHHDTVYLHAQRARDPEKKHKEPRHDPLLAVHRMKKVELTDRGFEFPEKYDFEKTFNLNFGVIKEKAFEAEVEFMGWAARHVSERIWSPDQKIRKTGKDRMLLSFSASSEPELISWVLSFGDEAKLVKPEWLAGKVAAKIDKMRQGYLTG